MGGLRNGVSLQTQSSKFEQCPMLKPTLVRISTPRLQAKTFLSQKPKCSLSTVIDQSRLFHHTKYLQFESSKPNIVKDIKLEPPATPENCCGNNCVNCVWNDYFKELDEYNTKMKELQEQQTVHDQQKKVDDNPQVSENNPCVIAQVLGNTPSELEHNLQIHTQSPIVSEEWKVLEGLEFMKPLPELCSHGLLRRNIPKNRYPNVLPYDENRVKMEPFGMGGSDYINASHIKSYKPFVAAQAPVLNAFFDFYRMIWDNNCHHVVMLTNYMEDGVLKAHDYIPRKGLQIYGNLIVELIDEQINKEVNICKVRLNKEGVIREFFHYHYLGWPDHDVPDEDSFLRLIQLVNSRYVETPSTPVVVHCSAGIGRTGTYIAVDEFLHDFSDKEQMPLRINLMERVYELRKQRSGMLTTEEQYRFIYSVMLHQIEKLNRRVYSNNSS